MHDSLVAYLQQVLSYVQGDEKSTTPRAYMVKESSEEICWRRDKSNDNAVYKEIIIDNQVDTVTKAFNFAVSKYGEKQCLGTRQVLGEMDEVQGSGKVFKKLSLGEYKWITYNEAHSLSTQFGRYCLTDKISTKHFARGLRELGVAPHTAIVIYAETRAEWIMSAFGAFAQSITVSTLYTNLGDDAICNTIQYVICTI